MSAASDHGRASRATPMTERPVTAPPEIADYYRRFPEESRLQSGSFQLEFERTKEILVRRLAPPPATIVDVGGAAGVYSAWLAGLGYTVHLVDVTRGWWTRRAAATLHWQSRSPR